MAKRDQAQPYKENQIFNSSFQGKSSSHILRANTETEQRRKPLASVRAPEFQNCFSKTFHLLGKSVPRFMVSLGVIHNFKVEPDPTLTQNNDMLCFVWSQHQIYQLLLNIVTQGNPHLHFLSNWKKYYSISIFTLFLLETSHQAIIAALGNMCKETMLFNIRIANFLPGQKNTTLWAAYISRNTR